MKERDFQKLAVILARHQKDRSALIPIIQEIQEAFGYLPRDALLRVADHLRLPPSTVYSVATFYARFYFSPRGLHQVQVCQGTACHVRGGRRILEAVKRVLNVKPGETTPNCKFSLERVACVGSCAIGPVVVIDEKVHGRMTAAKAVNLLKTLPVSEKPEPNI